MKCAYCGYEETKVMETRESIEATRRRRECLSCKRRFTTYERPDVVEIMVVKKDGTMKPFDREKVLVGMLKACEKRPVSREQVEQAVDEIKRSLKKRQGNEFSSRMIGTMVLNKLRKLDKVAYIRFASVYREFSDVASFQTELKKIINVR
ncbi:transcriptional regulator NrdR [Nanoarchaeota archaeon]